MIHKQLGNGINFKVQFKELLKGIEHELLENCHSKFYCDDEEALVQAFNNVFEQRLE